MISEAEMKCQSFNSLLCAAAKREGAVAPAAQFPHALLEAAERVFKAQVQASPTASKLQQEVARRLWELGVQHNTQHLTPDGLFCVDIALRESQVTLTIFLLTTPFPAASKPYLRAAQLTDCGARRL